MDAEILKLRGIKVFMDAKPRDVFHSVRRKTEP